MSEQDAVIDMSPADRLDRALEAGLKNYTAGRDFNGPPAIGAEDIESLGGCISVVREDVQS